MLSSSAAGLGELRGFLGDIEADGVALGWLTDSLRVVSSCKEGVS